MLVKSRKLRISLIIVETLYLSNTRILLRLTTILSLVLIINLK